MLNLPKVMLVNCAQNFVLRSVFKRWHLIWCICQKNNHFFKNLLIKRFFWYIWHFDTIAGYHLTELWNIFNISTKKWRSPSGTATAHTKFSGLEVFWLLWIKWSGWKCGMHTFAFSETFSRPFFLEAFFFWPFEKSIWCCIITSWHNTFVATFFNWHLLCRISFSLKFWLIRHDFCNFSLNFNFFGHSKGYLD